MNKREYKEYCERVDNFFKREGLNNLSLAVSEESDNICPGCNEERSFEPSFSWHSCDSCGSNLGGDRYHCTGYNEKEEEIYCYDVCPDCYYFAEYGCLDDMSMIEIEESQEEEGDNAID